jgi:hypothetical protein
MVFAPTASGLRKNGLPSGPSVLRTLNYLLDRELVYQYVTEEGEKYYWVYECDGFRKTGNN